MVQKQAIISLWRRGESLRATVTKFVREYEQSQQADENERRRVKGMRKQCLNAMDIHPELLNKDSANRWVLLCLWSLLNGEDNLSIRTLALSYPIPVDGI